MRFIAKATALRQLLGNKTKTSESFDLTNYFCHFSLTFGDYMTHYIGHYKSITE